MRKKPRIAFVISMFPELHETFILRELAALERRGLAFEIYSLQYPRDPVTLEDAKRLMRERTRYHRLFGLAALGALLHTLLRQPAATLRCVGQVLRDQWRTPMALLKSLAILPISCLIGEQAKASGVTHLHSHWANVPSTACWYLQQIHAWSWSAAIHGEDIFSPNPLLQRKLAQASFVVVCSALFQRHLQRAIAPTRCGDIHCNYHGLDPAVWQAALQIPNPREPRDGPLRVLTIGRLVPTKGHDTLLEACAQLRDRGFDWHLTLVGTGPEQRALEALCQTLKLEAQVSFAGALSFEQVLAEFARSDAFCLASVMLPGHPPDGIPNVIAEAMAFALPVVSTQTSAIPELVRDGQDGLLVPPQQADALASALQQLIEQPERARAMGHSARARVKALFSQEHNIDELLALFERYTHDGPLVEERA